MKGAQELRADTMQKMKTIELTEEEKQEREKARYEIWETKIRKQKEIKETMEGMGWENQKLKRTREKDKWKEQKGEQQGITHTKKKCYKDNDRSKKRNKERKGGKTKEKCTGPK